MNKKKNLIDHFIVLAGTGVVRLLLFAASIMIARILGAHDYGLFTLFYLSLTISSIIPNSIDTTYIKFARLEASKEKRAYFDSCTTIKSLYLILTLSAGALLLAITPTSNQAIKSITYGAMAGVFLCFSQSIATRYQENEKFVRHSLVDAIFATAISIAITYVYFSDINITIQNTFQIYSIISISIGVLFAFYLQATTNFIRAYDLRHMKSILHLGKWIIGVTICLFLFSRIDVFLLPSFVDFTEVGIYGVASQLMMTVSLMVRSMSKVILPKAMSAVSDKESLIAYLKSTTSSVILILLFILFLFTFSNQIIIHTYGQEYIAASTPFKILLIGTIFTTLNVPFSFLYYSLNAPDFRFIIEAIKLICGSILILALLSQYGIIGAAIGMAFTNMAYSLFSIILIYHKLQNHFKTHQHRIRSN